MNQHGPKTEARPRRVLLPALLALVVVGGGYLGWQRYHGPGRAGAEAARPAAPQAIPVSLAAVEASPFPVYLDGLGTVQAYNTVVVRTRVDGQIETLGFREGQMVRKDDILVQIDARPYRAALDQAQAKRAQDEATLTNAKADLGRYTKLGDYATRQQLDTQTATVSQLTAQIAADQAAIDSAQTQLSYATVRAPITGLAGFRLVDVGNIVNAQTQTGIVTLTQIEPISVIFTAPEDQLPDINAALRAGTVTVVAFAGDGKRKLSEGRLEIVNNQVDTGSGTIRLKAIFDNDDHALWPGLSVATRTLVSTMQSALTVPDEAVQHGPNGLFAYVVDDTGHAHVQRIAVSLSGNGRSVVTSGLSPGQKVVAAGQYRVAEGTLVRSQDPPRRQAAAAEAH